MAKLARPGIFPPEVWHQISSYLVLPSLLYLSLTSRTFHSLCEQRLQTHSALRTKYRRFDIFELENNDSHPFHTFLLGILHGNIPASYTLEMECGEDCKITEYGAEDPDVIGGQDPEPYPLSNSERELISNTIQASKWMYQQPTEEYVQKIADGDEDATLCVLIPLLRELRWLMPPISMKLLPRVIGTIAARERAIEDENRAELRRRPWQRVFPHLVQISTRAFNGEDNGVDLDLLAPFSAIPSVRRVIAAAVQNEEFRAWPADVPSSTVSEVYFLNSSITARAIIGFAQGIEGPCVIRQHFRTRFVTREEDEEEWNSFEISPAGAKKASAEGNQTLERSENIGFSEPLEDDESMATAWDWRNLIAR